MHRAAQLAFREEPARLVRSEYRDPGRAFRSLYYDEGIREFLVSLNADETSNLLRMAPSDANIDFVRSSDWTYGRLQGFLPRQCQSANVSCLELPGALTDEALPPHDSSMNRVFTFLPKPPLEDRQVRRILARLRSTAEENCTLAHVWMWILAHAAFTGGRVPEAPEKILRFREIPIDSRPYVVQTTNWILDGVFAKSQNESEGWQIERNPTFRVIRPSLLRRRYGRSVRRCPSARLRIWSRDPLSLSKARRSVEIGTTSRDVLVPVAGGYGLSLWCGERKLSELVCPSSTSLVEKCLKHSFHRGLSVRRRWHPKISKRKLSEGADRHDLYGKYWFYEMLKLPPGFVRKVLGLAADEVAACLGSVVGCLICIGVRTVIVSTEEDEETGEINTDPPECTDECSLFIGETCASATGAVVFEINEEHSVVCTELHRQGRLSTEKYLQDSEYGLRLMREDPAVLHGYRLLAAPLVALMRRSPLVTDAVQFAADPWIHEMLYREGHADGGSPVGSVILDLGGRFCKNLWLTIENVTAATNSSRFAQPLGIRGLANASRVA